MPFAGRMYPTGRMLPPPNIKSECGSLLNFDQLQIKIALISKNTFKDRHTEKNMSVQNIKPRRWFVKSLCTTFHRQSPDVWRQTWFVDRAMNCCLQIWSEEMRFPLLRLRRRVAQSRQNSIAIISQCYLTTGRHPLLLKCWEPLLYVSNERQSSDLQIKVLLIGTSYQTKDFATKECSIDSSGVNQPMHQVQSYQSCY